MYFQIKWLDSKLMIGVVIMVAVMQPYKHNHDTGYDACY